MNKEEIKAREFIITELFKQKDKLLENIKKLQKEKERMLLQNTYLRNKIKENLK